MCQAGSVAIENIDMDRDKILIWSIVGEGLMLGIELEEGSRRSGYGRTDISDSGYSRANREKSAMEKQEKSQELSTVGSFLKVHWRDKL